MVCLRHNENDAHDLCQAVALQAMLTTVTCVNYVTTVMV